jgi:hypothetical protein
MGNTQISPNIYQSHYPDKFPCKQLEETSYGDLYALNKCITEAIGLKSDSLSASDIYVITDGNNAYYMKLFITGFDLNHMMSCSSRIDISSVNKLNNNIKPLIYEYGIYLGKINKLVKYNICPFFITTKGGSLHNTKKDIIQFLSNKFKNIHTDDIIEKNFDRNIWILINNTITDNRLLRPEIHNNNIKYSIDNNYIPIIDKTPSVGMLHQMASINDNYKFGYFITQSFNETYKASHTFLVINEKILYTLNNIPNPSNPSININPSNALYNYKQILYLFLFQMAIAFKSLELTKIVNCDLHFGNILIDTEFNFDIINNPTCYDFITNNKITDIENKYLFIVEDKYYNINLPFMIKLYDFDRSYMYGDGTSETELKNKHLSIHPFYNKSNKRDFIYSTTNMFHSIYSILENYDNSKMENKYISEIFNEYADCVVNIINIDPNTKFDALKLFETDITSNTITTLPNDNNIISKLQIQNYNNLNPKSKSFLYLLMYIRDKYKYNDSKGRVRNGDIRRSIINDNTFNDNTFHNIDTIISNIYKLIDKKYKDISVMCNNNCLTDSSITKCYLNTSIFDNDGIFNKNNYFDYINNIYYVNSYKLENIIKQKDAELIKKDDIITDKEFEIFNVNKTVKKKDKEIQLLMNNLKNVK